MTTRLWMELVQHAQSLGYSVRNKEEYNPGGTEYRSSLFSLDGSFVGYVDKWIKSRSLGRDVTVLAPDPNASAWKILPPLKLPSIDARDIWDVLDGNGDFVMLRDMIVICPECNKPSIVREWIACEVPCDDCGSHFGVECPICSESFDTIHARDMKIQNVPTR